MFQATAESARTSFDNRWLETTTPSALRKASGLFALWRSHPSFAKEGIACPTVSPFMAHHPSYQEGKFAGRHIFLRISRTGRLMEPDAFAILSVYLRLAISRLLR